MYKLKRRVFNKNLTKENLKSKKGAELVESVLIVAISIVIIVTLFYPEISRIMSSVLIHLGNWFDVTINKIGVGIMK